jgi:hypothetical protein
MVLVRMIQSENDTNENGTNDNGTSENDTVRMILVNDTSEWYLPFSLVPFTSTIH